MYDHPLRLAVGSHPAGSGKGCALNVVRWERGEHNEIGWLPDGVDLTLAWYVARANDASCTHRNSDLLCPMCSIRCLDLAHRIVGTEGRMEMARREAVQIEYLANFHAFYQSSYYDAALAAINKFEELTGFKASAPEPATVVQAIERMQSVTA